MIDEERRRKLVEYAAAAIERALRSLREGGMPLTENERLRLEAAAADLAELLA